MKKILLFLWLLPFFTVAQNSYTVSNVPGVTANYRTLQGAIDSVAAGSTLYVFPSVVDYGNVNINKKLFITGTGFMLDQNADPFTAPNVSGVTVSSVYFMPGSSNSYMEGIQLTGNTNEGRFFRFFLDSVNNVTINRCLAEIWETFPSGNYVFQTRNANNCTISQCYLTEVNLEVTNHSGGEFYIELGTGSQNLQFNNNVIDNRSSTIGFTFNHNVNTNNYGTVIFTNNTFHGGINNSGFSNYTYFNNFFISTDTADAVSQNVIGLSGSTGFNITNARNLFPAGSNNLQGVNPDSIFQYASFGYHSWDQSWQVLDNSFVKHYANDGGEVGAFGGYNPYVLSGIPALPEIYNLTVDPDSKNRGHVLVRIKAKASN
jgi:hypothetical protein